MATNGQIKRTVIRRIRENQIKAAAEEGLTFDQLCARTKMKPSGLRTTLYQMFNSTIWPPS